MPCPARFRALLHALLLCCYVGMNHGARAATAATSETAAPPASVQPTATPTTAQTAPQQAPIWHTSLLKPAKSMSLKEAVLLAVRSNASLKTAYLDRVLDRFRLDYAKAEFQPQGNLRFDTSQSRSETGQAAQRRAAALDLGLALPSGGRIEFGWALNRQRDNTTAGSTPAATSNLALQLTQPLLRGAGQIAQSNLRLADLTEAQARLQLRANVMATITTVINAYRSLQEARAQVALANEALKRSQTLAEINQTLVETGRLGRLELLQTRADIASGELEVIEAETRADNARLSLLKLLDMDLLSDIIPEDMPQGDAKPLAIPLPDEIRALALAESLRPDFLSARLAEQASELGLQKARDQTLWQLDLVVSAARKAQATSTSDAFGNLATGRPSHSAALVLNIPLNDRAARLALSTADIEQKKTRLRTSDIHQALRVEVMNALRNAWNTGRQTVLASQNLDLNRQKLDAELAKLNVGRTSLFQVTSFQQSLKQAEQTRINAFSAHAHALTQLDLVLGTTLQTWEIVLD